jgi:hypothetical protein
MPNGVKPLKVYRNTNLLATDVEVKPVPGKVYWVEIHNTNAAVEFVHFYDALAANVTVGTTTPVFSLGVAASGQRYIMPADFPIHEFGTAITIAASTTATGNTAPGTGLVVHIGYV